MSPEVAARLESARIAWHATETGYTMFTRDNCAAVAHRQAEGYSLGSTGFMTDAGFAYLVHREGRALFAVHGGAETPAAPEQVEAVRRFSEDLKAALAR